MAAEERKIPAIEKQFNNLVMEWNRKINLVSRQKQNVFDFIEDSKIFFGAIEFKPGLNILDLGTGGGFPGIVIAIHHPEVNIALVDSLQKKINAVSDIVRKLELENVIAVCGRAESLVPGRFLNGKMKHHYDYIVARSVATLQDLCAWSKSLVKPGGRLVTLKGADIQGELDQTRKLPFIKNIRRKPVEDRLLVTAEYI